MTVGPGWGTRHTLIGACVCVSSRGWLGARVLCVHAPGRMAAPHTPSSLTPPPNHDTAPTPRSEAQLPIAFLRARNISVRARSLDPRAAAPLTGLRFAYVDPNLDVDVSRHMEATGVVEIGISQVGGCGCDAAEWLAGTVWMGA
jgi:hypothetical protein